MGARIGRLALRLWLLCALVATVAGAYIETIVNPPDHRSFGLFYASALAWRSGADPYGVVRTTSAGLTLPNLNPPVWTLLFAPLTYLSPDNAAIVWGVLSLAALFGGFIVATRDGELGVWRSWRGLAVLAGPILWETFAQGQVYTFVMFPLAAGAVFLRRQRLPIAAACLGLAIPLKPPLFIVVVALLWADRRVALGTIATGAFWSLLPLPLVGIQPYLGWLKVAQQAPIASPLNALLTSVAVRWGGPSAGLVTALLVVGLLALVCHRVRDPEAALWLGVCAGLAASPITWPTYFALLMPGFVWIGRRRHFSRLFDGALILGTVPLWLFLLSPLSVVPIYAVALVGFVAEMLCTGLKAAMVEAPTQRLSARTRQG